MSGLIRAALVTCLLAVPLQAGQAQELDAARLAGTVERGMAMWRVPGMAVAVLDRDEIVLQRGFGRTAADGAAVDTHTLFANASTTKAMIVAGLLALADEGRLDLDDPVIDYIPELHFASEVLTQQVRIRDLLAHRTGLPSTDFWTFRQLTPLAEQVRRLRLVAAESAPRSRLIYQNTMYELAGLIIERVSGRRWDEFLRSRLWQPIGMHETYGTRGDIPPKRAHVQPHAEVAGRIREIPWDLPADRADAAGSVWSSIHDMVQWAQFLLAGGVTGSGTRLLSQESIDAMFEPQQLASADDFYPTVALTGPHWRSYGLGWFQQDFQGRKIDFHTGSLDGLHAIIGLDRGNDRAVIVMANLDGSELRHALLWEVMDRESGAERRDWLRDVYDLYAARAADKSAEWTAVVQARLTDTTPSLPLDAYLGTYSNAVLGSIEFRRRDDKLLLRTGMYRYEVSHWHLDTFLVDYLTWPHGVFMSFSIDGEGKVSALKVFDGEFLRE